MIGAVEKGLSGWGNYCSERCFVVRPESLDALGKVITQGSHGNYISRGLGRSYGDSAVNRGAGVIDQTGLNRFLDFDEETGVLECEAGVSLDEIIQAMLPRGWFLPTTPGTKFVTIGGAIAADVHGKNHHCDGSFGNFIVDLQLMTASGEILHCSPTRNQPVFWATVGGMGLTGVVLSARVQLVQVPSAYCRVTHKRTANLSESLECFAATDQDYRYSVAWIDCLASGTSLGRGVVMLGNNASVDDLSQHQRDAPLALPAKRLKSVPFMFPGFALNAYSVRAFNWLYYRSHGDNQAIVDFDSFFYPLDSIMHWNRIYGRRGFIQYQAFFPSETSHQGLRELLEAVAQSRMASFLAVLKSSGAANPGLLSFLRPGHTLALDLPNNGETLRMLVRRLDRILLKHGGRLYLAKDAATTPEVLSGMYGRLDEFRRVKRDIDPNGRFMSSQSRRLGL